MATPSRGADSMPKKQEGPKVKAQKRARAKDRIRKPANLVPSRQPRIDTSWHAPFLAALATCGNVSYACKIAKVKRRLAYEHRERFEDFRDAWDEASEMAVDGLEYVAYNRAVEEDSRLLMFLLSAMRPQKYREQRYTPDATKEIKITVEHQEVAPERD